MQGLDDVLKQIGTPGWGGLKPQRPDQLEAQLAAIQVKGREEARQIAELFSGPQGERALQWLVRTAFFRPSSEQMQAGQTAEAYAIAAARREGEQNLVRTILAAIAHATSAEAPPPKPQE